MALGRRGEQDSPMWIAATELPRSPGHVFYRRLDRLLSDAGFDRYVEDRCREFYAKSLGRPSIPPGVYFRMLFVGFFEGIDSQRGIAWRCSDSLSIREFIGLGVADRAPDHSSLTVIRQRLPHAVYEGVFAFVLGMVGSEGLLDGRTVSVDSTQLEANAAMKSIVRRANGENWRTYVKRLAVEDGEEDPDDDDARRLDRKRKKSVSNADWKSPTDEDSRIARMKDGRTRLAYKAEHVVDLASDVVLAARIDLADRSDASTLVESVLAADLNLARAGSETRIEEVVADKGYHAAERLTECVDLGIRTYIPERREPNRRRWGNKPGGWQAAFYANRRRVRGQRGRWLQRLRGEHAERSIAHSCVTGGGRRTWLRGIENVRKRYTGHIVGQNLSRLMYAKFGIGTPRGLQGAAAALLALMTAAVLASRWLRRRITPILGLLARFIEVGRPSANISRLEFRDSLALSCSTGC
jgi:transposase